MNDTKSTIKRLLASFKPYSMQLAAALLLAVLNVAATLYAPILTGQAIDLIVKKGKVDFKGLVPLLCMFAVTIVIVAVSQYFMTLFLNKVTFAALRDLRDTPLKI